ncbi:MAG TPA: arginine repressor [Terriglobales bacterium]|nr:arginine repressor [Terriglobales bacterium]
MSKVIRHQRITDLISEEAIYTQEELRSQLRRSGIHVNQATLSRDLRELGLVKTVNGYALPAAEEGGGAPMPALNHLLREFVVDVREAENLLVLKTTAGSAQPVAAALDSEGWEEIIGTIAGDDTILIITKSKAICHKLATRVRETIE